MARFQCKQKCFFGGSPKSVRMYQEGEVYIGEKANEHFINLDEELSEDGDLDGDELPVAARKEIIKTALKQMNYDDDEQWTKDGLPLVQVIEKKTNLDTNRAEIEQTWPDFNRDTIPLSKDINRSSSFSQAMDKI